MRKIFTSILALASLSALAIEPADTITVGDLHYILHTLDEAAVVRPLHGVEGDSYAGNVVVPATIDYDGMTYTVTGVSRTAFSDAPYLESVTLPATITHLPAGSFRFSPLLASVQVQSPVYKTNADGLVVTTPTGSEVTFDFTTWKHPYSTSVSDTPGFLHYPIANNGIALTFNDEAASATRQFIDMNETHLRVYRDAVMTVTSERGPITEIRFEYQRSFFGLKPNVGTLTGKVWTGSAQKIDFEVTRRTAITKMTVKTADNSVVVYYPQAKTASPAIPETHYIAPYAFENTAAAELTFPASLKELGVSAISSRSLNRIRFNGDVPQYTDSPVLSTDKERCVLAVPAASVEAYKADPVFKNFRNIVAGATTGIRLLPSFPAETSEKAYDLSGRPARRGLLIGSGKKYFKK